VELRSSSWWPAARWARTAEGWALNFDGSDAATVFSLPRLELRSGPRGWTGDCLLSDGTRSGCTATSPGGLAEAKAVALEAAERLLGPQGVAALRATRSGT